MANIKEILDARNNGIDFAQTPTHTVEYDPSAPVKTIRGRSGEFQVMDVIENGKTRSLSLSNKSLLKQLVSISEKCTLEITRVGESYATTYNVRKVK